jgi:hypothetical protein
MKHLTNLTLAALTLASVVAASAQTEIRFAASNADRAPTQTAITNILDAGRPWTYRGLNGKVTFNGTSYTENNLATLTGSNFGTFNGTFQGQNVIIKTNYAGALAGIAAVASSPPLPQRFDSTNGTGTGAIPENPQTSSNPANYVEAVVDFGMSSNFQSTSPFNGFYNGHNYVPIREQITGVSPMGFYASPGFPADNITTQQAQRLYSNGSVPLALFTGNWTNGDQNKIVYALGRSTDAGQRFAALGEIGFGTTGPVTHWQPTANTAFTNNNGILSGATVNAHRVWPTETVSGIVSPGSSGFAQGSIVSQWLTVILSEAAYKGRFTYQDEETGQTRTGELYPNATAGYYIGYATTGDGNPRILDVDTNGNIVGNIAPQFRGKKLKYNGIENTSANVRNGQYTLWVYSRIITRTSGVTPGIKANFVEALRTRIQNVDAAAGGGIIHKPAPFDPPFNVSRETDGGPVRPGFKQD